MTKFRECNLELYTDLENILHKNELYEFEDARGVTRNRKSKKKNRQHNDQKKKDKRTNNDIQNITQKTND
jgi:hypothetical protein